MERIYPVISAAAVVLGLILGNAVSAAAYPTITATGGSLHFWAEAEENYQNIYVDIGYGRITETSAGASDPLLKNYANLWIDPAFNNQSYDYILTPTDQADTWRLTRPDQATIEITSKRQNTPNSVTYLTGNTVAQTINFSTNEIIFSPVIDLQVVDNDIQSPTLAEMSQYATGALSFYFDERDGLVAWLGNPDANTFESKYNATLTATPEPGQWALMIVGAAVMGLFLQKSARPALQRSTS